MLPSGAPATTIEGGIHHDAMDPRQRRRVPAEPMTRTEGTKKSLLHHVFRFVTDVACGNGSQLPPGLFVQVYYRVFQGNLQQVRLPPSREALRRTRKADTTPAYCPACGFVRTMPAMIADQRAGVALRRICRARTSVSGGMRDALTGLPSA